MALLAVMAVSGATIVSMQSPGISPAPHAKPVKIAEIRGEAITFVVSTDVLLRNWNNNLKKLASLEANLTTLAIEKGADNTYYAVAKGSTYQSVTIVAQAGNSIYDYQAKQKYTITCTTQACATTTGCTPENGGKCAPCSGDCIKTTSVDMSIMSN